MNGVGRITGSGTFVGGGVNQLHWFQHAWGCYKKVFQVIRSLSKVPSHTLEWHWRENVSGKRLPDYLSLEDFFL